MLHTDIPTISQFARLSGARADACVSIYLPTTRLPQQIGASRIELANLFKQAHAQLVDAAFEKRRLAMIEEHIADLIDDDAFWQHQSSSLAVLATADHVDTFRLPNHLLPMAAVSGRFHLKPLLRAITFPHTAFVLALAESGVRLIEIFAEGPPSLVKVDALPRDAASAAGRASINDRSPSGRIHGAEGKKVRLTQYARKIDAALKPLLTGSRMPLILAANEPLASIYRGVCSSADLLATTIGGNPDETTDADLASAARRLLDEHYAGELQSLRALYAVRAESGRATADMSDAARAASQGAIDTLLVDIDTVVEGTYDEETGRITLADKASAESYGVVDAIAARALATGAKVMGVRAADLPAGGHLAAILRYAA